VNTHTQEALFDELRKIIGLRKIAKIKSNDRFPARTKTNIGHLAAQVHEVEGLHREKAVKLLEEVGAPTLFEMLHSMRRWYSGQTMATRLLKHNDTMSSFMKLDPEDVVGVYRGFKVPKDHPLASAEVGQRLTIPVTRNRGISSWSTSQDVTNRFSGGGKGKVGLVVKLVDSKGVTPILAPPSHTEPWFNALYEKAIGTSFRPKEHEYLLSAPEVRVEIVRVKR
jgi:hypothetical protein